MIVVSLPSWLHVPEATKREYIIEARDLKRAKSHGYDMVRDATQRDERELPLLDLEVA